MSASDSFSSFVQLREGIRNFVTNGLVGPESEHEVLDEPPLSRYSAAILFACPTPEGEKAVQQGNVNSDQSFREEEAEGSEYANSFFPSAMGLTFLVSKNCREVEVTVRGGRYTQSKDAGGSGEQNKKHLPWIREYLGPSIIPVSLEKTDTYPQDGYSISCTVRRHRTDGVKTCIITLINTAESDKPQYDNENAIFQIEMGITANDRTGFIHFDDLISHSGDEEEASLKLLYRKRRFYAAGHGCSAEWEIGTDGACNAIRTEAIPYFEIPKVDFEFRKYKAGIEGPNLKIRHFAFDEDSEIISSLSRIADHYEEWISHCESDKDVPVALSPVAEKHIEKCREACARMRAGIEMLSVDGRCMKAFKLANQAMVRQRIHIDGIKNQRFPDDEKVPFPEPDYESIEDTWRPFQIAFFILNLVSISDKKSPDREIVDLIWFPTGGGKTEAYLALTAYTIFLRRLVHGENGGGTTAIMRYTLRLLALQQFQRACTLICACELLRLEQGLPGGPITIGSWVGKAATPNTVTGEGGAQEALDMLRETKGNAANPFQVLFCPWCGTYMIKKGDKGRWGYEVINEGRKKRFIMNCPERKCPFNKELPIRVVDEDIYRSPPTFLFGTVDKFASLPWNEEAGAIFGRGKASDYPAPELIIQDELHLISGALGSMVGIYETAIDMLCTKDGIKPKIIASTATIRRAAEQCKSLYARKMRQFPPAGIDASDSFFAREIDVKESPGRLYVGILPSGQTSTTLRVRQLSYCLQALQAEGLQSDVLDAYWTQVIYCNSLKELGKTKTLAFADIAEYSESLCEKLKLPMRRFEDDDEKIKELTSRVASGDIPEILRRLALDHQNEEAVHLILATVMISVGVDVDRLGLMTIIGQPNTAAEYIQASSRVGRKKPGIVFVLFNPTKSRDRSHYEQFRRFHESVYRYVEPTSVTPFSPPVRDRALHAVAISLIRHELGINEDVELRKLTIAYPGMKEIIMRIAQRIAIVDGSETKGSENDLRKFFEDIQTYHDMVSFSKKKDMLPLMKTAGKERESGLFATMRSMRSTESESNIRVLYI